MATKTKKRRKASPKQLAALARGRKKLASKRPIKVKKRSSTRKTSKSVQSRIVVVQPQERKKMARKKSSSTKTTTKRKSSGRRRIAGMAGKAKGMVPVVKKLVMAVGGGVAAGVIANKVPVANPKVKAAIPVVAGILLAGTLGKKKAIFHEIGEGMAIVGAIGLLKQFMPNVPMLAGEDVILIPDGSYQQYSGDMMQLGYDQDDIDEYMGDPLSLGEDEEEEYLSPASM